MSIRFSEVTLSDADGLNARVLIGGYPDKNDLWANEYLCKISGEFARPIQVCVQRYCFLTPSNEEDADDNHLYLIDIYDELVDECNILKPSHSVGAFTDRDDVEHGEYFTFQMEAPHYE